MESSQEACRHCREPHVADDLDPFGWCATCRQEVIRRARPWARFTAVGVAALFAGLIAFVLAPSPRFMIAWAALLVVIYFLTYKVAQRVAFDVIRLRMARRSEEG